MRKIGLALALAGSAFLVACGGGGGGAPTTADIATTPPLVTAPVVAPASAPSPVAVTYKATDWNAAIGWWSDLMTQSQTDTQVKAMIDHLVDVGYSGVTFTYAIPVDTATGHIQNTTVITRMLTMVDYAYSKGLKVNVKLCWTIPSGTFAGNNVNQWFLGTDTANWYDGTATVKPAAATFLSDIKSYFTSMVPTFNAHHVGMVILGTENDFLTFSQYTTQWADIVSNMHTAGYTGVLTYDAIYSGTVGENIGNVAIWNSMDKIGLSFYPTFFGGTLPDAQSALNTWTYRTAASLVSSCSGINNSAAPTVSIVNDLVQLKANNGNKQIIFTENTYQDSALAGMNWHSVPTLEGCNVQPDATQHVYVLQAQLEAIKSPSMLKGVVTGFNMMGYDPWEYSQTDTTAAGNYMGLWKNYDQMTGQAAETTMKNYLAAGL